ncbi:cytochrome P450 [Phyllosticta citriasiana]|uniref:Cytochrome P450 n=1 Tax=Phyllosticta citriasiana TaxID=595635 RepID=A0ABR1L0F0_9PEZI
MGLSSSAVPLSAVAAISTITYLFSRWSDNSGMSKIPSMDERFKFGFQLKANYLKLGKELLREGYCKFPQDMFRLMTQFGPTVVVSRDLMGEVIKKPDDTIIFMELDMEVEHTGFTSDDMVVETIRNDLTPNLGRIMPVLSTEVQNALRAGLPSSKEWTPLNINEVLLRIVAIASGSTFVGTDFCHKEEWIHLSTQYTMDVIIAAEKLKILPAVLRSLAIELGWAPDLKRITEHRENAKQYLRSIIQKRGQTMASGDGSCEKPDDCLQWMSKKAEQHMHGYDDDAVAISQLSLSMDAIHSTTITTTQALLNLATHPSVLTPLRNELTAAPALSPPATQQPHQIDAILRLSPVLLVIGKRVALQPIPLSNGTTLPAGTHIACPSGAVGTDPSMHADPLSFRLDRFLKTSSGTAPPADAAASTTTRNALTASTKHSLHFGFGRHSCPGRFFAAMEIKLVFAFLVQGWDVALGEKGQASRELRPAEREKGDSITSDSSALLYVRRRVDAE